MYKEIELTFMSGRVCVCSLNGGKCLRQCPRRLVLFFNEILSVFREVPLILEMFRK